MTTHTADTFATILAGTNAAFALVFAIAMLRRDEPWRWPPSWAWVVANWLFAKSIALGTLALLWRAHIVGFHHHPPGVWAWVAQIGFVYFTLSHALAAWYFMSGRAAVDPPWNGEERRRRVRRRADRERLEAEE